MKALLTGLALLLAASTALAADGVGPWYIGIGGGQSSLHKVCDFAADVGASAGCDDDGVAGKIMLGTRIYKYAGLELSYIDAGEARINKDSAPTGTMKINPRLVNLFVTFELPLAVGGRLGLLAKVGGTYYDTNYERTGFFNVFVNGTDGISGAIGAGVSWRGWKHFSVRAEWEHFNDVSVRDGDLDLVTANVLFHF